MTDKRILEKKKRMKKYHGLKDFCDTTKDNAKRSVSESSRENSLHSEVFGKHFTNIIMTIRANQARETRETARRIASPPPVVPLATCLIFG